MEFLLEYGADVELLGIYADRYSFRDWKLESEKGRLQHYT